MRFTEATLMCESPPVALAAIIASFVAHTSAAPPSSVVPSAPTS